MRKPAKPWSGALNVSRVCALLVLLLALLVMGGWIAEVQLLVQLLPEYAPMQFGTALGLLLGSLALLARSGRWAQVLSSLLLGWAVVHLLADGTGLRLPSDQWFLTSEFQARTTVEGRMSSYTSACFLLVAGAGLWRRSAPYLLALVSLQVLATLALYLLDWHVTAAWSDFSRMAVHTASGFLFLAVGGLALAWRARQEAVPAWLQGGGLLVGAGLSLVLSLAMAERDRLLEERRRVADGELATQSLAVRVQLGMVLLDEAAAGAELRRPYPQEQGGVVIGLCRWDADGGLRSAINAAEPPPSWPPDQAPGPLQAGYRLDPAPALGGFLLSRGFVDGGSVQCAIRSIPGFLPGAWSAKTWSTPRDFRLEHLASALQPGTELPPLLSFFPIWLLLLGFLYCVALSVGGVLLRNSARIAAGLLQARTEMGRTRAELRETEEHLRNLIGRVPHAVLGLAPGGRIELANAAAGELFGYEEGALCELSLEELFPERVEQLRAALARARGGDPGAAAHTPEQTLEARHLDGRRLAVGIQPLPIQVGSEVRIMLAAEDRSETRAEELALNRTTAALEDSNRKLLEFAGLAAAELRQPLQRIGTGADRLQREVAPRLPEASQRHLRQLRQRVHRLESLLGDLLAYARAGDADTPLESLDLGDLARGCVEVLAPPAGCQISLPSPGLVVEVQRAPLELVLRNLLDNAIKHHDAPDRAQIEVQWSLAAEGLHVSVRDDGPGIPAQFGQKVFGLFETLRTRDEVEGSGLGLAIIRRTLETRGGWIQLVERAGRGCEFVFIWPLGSRNGAREDRAG